MKSDYENEALEGRWGLSHMTAGWFEETFGGPTKVQEQAWPAIARGEHTLVSAPTGTGKTLSAFLVFIDRLKQQARAGELGQELQVIYISPLKSLAGDIRENLKRPLSGLAALEEAGESYPIEVALRTGDTTQSEREKMLRHPPHILLTTPESLFLLLTGQRGQKLLSTAKAVILDELHAMIDTKRGAHLMLSLARLDGLCGRNLQRIGLSATIEPLDVAAAYLSPDPVAVIAPKMEKEIRITVTGPFADENGNTRKEAVWENLALDVYRRCQGSRCVIAFVEGRRNAEKLAYYVNQAAGEEFARTHHGSIAKEQRLSVEEDLRSGRLRLLCATSSMELGIDVGAVDQVFQVGCPFSISSTMQRLGRAGHNPGRVSVMYMFPRTAPESLFCGMTARTALEGGVEYAHPPMQCLDILSQHLVSMAVGPGYSVDEVMEILPRAYPFAGVTRQDVESVLAMLAGDYEHERDIPVRPRVLYDRIHGRVEGDPYSRMLAVSAGGTIPDKGLYSVKTAGGVKLGELDEEFVYESRKGDAFLLGTFGWKIAEIKKDEVIVEPTSPERARVPFWKGEIKGRPLKTSLAFGRMFRGLSAAGEEGRLGEALQELGLDENASKATAGFLERQMEATDVLPDDRTIVVEHFCDHTGSHQMMVHSLFGRQVNAPLALLLQQAACRKTGLNVGCVDEENGLLLYPYGEDELPEGLLYELSPENARPVLEAILPQTSLFNITFRYNAARALMMGMRRNGRQPLWLQRIRSADMLDGIIAKNSHPLVRETRRECVEDQWDIAGLEYVLNGIRSGLIAVHEVHVEIPSPMSLPLQWQVEAAQMYEYSPTLPSVLETSAKDLENAVMIRPEAEDLAAVSERKRLPEDERQLHSLLMAEGDLIAGELEVPIEWLEELTRRGRAAYIEPGLWIAMEQREEYLRALEDKDREACLHILRRLLRYRGPHTAEEASQRYAVTEEEVNELLLELCRMNAAVEQDGVYYHAELYGRARQRTIQNRRRQVSTLPGRRYAALMAGRVRTAASPKEQLRKTLRMFSGSACPAALWENVLFPARVRDYRGSVLDEVLSCGEFFWRMGQEGSLVFYTFEELDWDAKVDRSEELTDEEERAVYRALTKRGASFLQSLAGLVKERSPFDILMELAKKGLVCADSFQPVRQWLKQDTMKKSPARQRVSARVKAMNAGRWDVVRPLCSCSMDQMLDRAFDRAVILCRETAAAQDLPWQEALETLRVWEYTGRARRGYYVEGMSGAQFIRDRDFAGVTAALEHEEKEEVIWLTASDPAQVWGKSLPHQAGRSFLNVAGTAAALAGGEVIAVMERQGRVLRVFDGTLLDRAMEAFVHDFRCGRIYAGAKRLTVKEYPADAAKALKNAGFQKEMQDYVYYW